MQAFEGIRVLDLTHILAGPFCSYQLAVLGADVIKIEPVDVPDIMRACGPDEDLNEAGMGLFYQGQASNKRALAVDLKAPEGQEIVKALAATADVIVENYRPGALADLGLGYKDIREIKHDIVYCSLSGFGETGPKGRDTAYDNVIQAFSGLMSATGTAETAPVMVGTPALDYGSGAQAAFAIASALLRRERTGEGQRLDVAMLDAAMMLMVQTLMSTQALGEQPAPRDRGKGFVAAYGCYRAAEGLIMLGIFTPGQHRRMWRVLGREDLAEEARRSTIGEIAARRAQDEAILREILIREPAGYWENLFNAAGIPAARVRSVAEALSSEQLAARPVLGAPLPTGPKGTPVKPAIAAFCAQEDGPALTSPPPRHGEHSVQILTELGYDLERRQSLHRRRIVGA